MINFETIKGYYDKGFWAAAMVKSAVAKGKLTVEEYESITGEVYD